MKPLPLAFSVFAVLATSAIVYSENVFPRTEQAESARSAGADAPAESPQGSVLSAQDISENGGSHLDLSASELTKVPDNVFRISGLTVLNVSHNRITGSIQTEIGKLVNLQVLDASYNQMTGVPAEIGHLSELEMLNLSNNRLTGLPHELGDLKKLKTLDISGNKYSVQDLKYIKSRLPPEANIIVK